MEGKNKAISKSTFSKAKWINKVVGHSE